MDVTIFLSLTRQKVSSVQLIFVDRILLYKPEISKILESKSYMTEEWLDIIGSNIMELSHNDKSSGHVIVNYNTRLRNCLTVAEPENIFYRISNIFSLTILYKLIN